MIRTNFNNEAESAKKKQEQIKNILRLGSSETKNQNNDDLYIFLKVAITKE